MKTARLSISSFALTAVVVLLLLFASAPASAQVSGFYQWTVQGFATQSAALTEVAAGAFDSKLPVLVSTADSSVTTFGTPTPFVVFRWQFVDFWCCVPDHFTYSITSDLHTAQDLLFVYCTRINPSRKCGITTLAPAPFAGEQVVWQTTP